MFFCILFANYAPQSLIFSTINEINITGYQQNYVETDCDWFNDLAETYFISQITFLCEYEIDKQVGKEYCYLIEYTDSISVESMMIIFEAEPKVELAEPDLYATPFSNDTYFDDQHSLTNIGMTQVWDDENLQYFGNNIKVGVVDSGIDLGLGNLPIHEDLADNLYDDGQGNHGYNAYAYVSNITPYIFYPHDNIGHGTAVAGIIGARHNNNTGIAGIAGGKESDDIDGCDLYSIKIAEYIQQGASVRCWWRLSAALRGIYYAYVNDGVRIFNCSFGFTSADENGEYPYTVGHLNNLMTRISSPDVTNDPGLFICAAGNNNSNYATYPSLNDYAISVAGTDTYDIKTSYSTYHSSVDICAPGGTGLVRTATGVVTTVPQDTNFFHYTHPILPNPTWSNNYEWIPGTSASAPMVTGAVVLVKEAFPNLTMQEIKGRITGTADNISQTNPEYELIGKLGSGRLNVYKALTENEHPTMRINAVQITNSYAIDENVIICGDPQAQMNIQLKNWWRENSQSFSGVLSTEDPDIVFTQNEAYWDIIQQNGVAYSTHIIQFEDNSSLPRDVLFKLLVEYDGILDSLFFKVHRQLNYDIMKIPLIDRKPTSELVIDDMDMDGIEEIALTTENNNHFYVNLLTHGQVMEFELLAKSPTKPAFADLNYDGIKELIVIDNLGYLYIFDTSLNLINSQQVFVNYTLQSFTIDDVSDDGQLDIVMLLKFTENNWAIRALVFHDDFSYDEYDHYINNSVVLSKNLAIGNVDISTCYEVLYITATTSGGEIFVNMHKITLINNNRSYGFIESSGNIEILPVSTTRNLKVTDMILSKPHPLDNMDKKSYVYYGRGYYSDNIIPPSRSVGEFTLYCIDFWENEPTKKWEHDYNDDNPYSITQWMTTSTMDALNIIAGDFIPGHPGVEIITAATDEIIDSETGEFICFTIDSWWNSLTDGLKHRFQKYQPSIILDYDEETVKELFLYKNNVVKCYDEYQIEDVVYRCTLPDSIRSLISGKARFSNYYDLYALGYNLQNHITSIYYIPLTATSNELLYEWRQFNNNGRKTCEFYQPIPCVITEDIIIWNNSVIDREDTVIQENSLIFDAGITVRMNKGAKVSNFSSFKLEGTEDTLRVEIAGLCNNDIRDYWKGIEAVNGSTLKSQYAYIKNAEIGINLFNTGDYIIKNSKFKSNFTAISGFNTNIDLGFDEIYYSDYGITAYHFAKANMGDATPYDQGHSILRFNEVGMYNTESEFYMAEGNNDLAENNDYNIIAGEGCIGVKATQNYWGSNDEGEILAKFLYPEWIDYSDWNDTPYNFNLNKTYDNYQIAEGYRLHEEWSFAVPYYYTVYNDSIQSIEDNLSIKGLFLCHKNLNQLGAFKTWVFSELSNGVSPTMSKQLKNNLALANRATGDYQDAIDYYESIIDNNPSYNDSCFAVIDLGFTWLEANYGVKGNYPKYRPKSMPDHVITANKLLKSILLNEPISDNTVSPVVPILYQNYPNPFNPTTTICFSLPAKSKVDLTIYNIKGQKVATLISSTMEKGKYNVVWDSKDKTGKRVSSGVYFYKLRTPNKSIIKKCLLLK